jgi:predicted permease
MWPFRRRTDEDFRREIDAHLALETDRLMADGLPADEARRAAVRRFGNVTLARERFYESGRGRWLDELRLDLRHAARALRHSPSFALAAIGTLGLGIGATSTVFALADVVLLRPLPVREADRLAHIYTSCRAGNPYCASSYPEFLDYRARNRAFTDMAAFEPQDVSIGTGGSRWVGTALFVSTNYFTLVGVTPHTGRLISPAWNVAADPPAILAYDAWHTRFGGDPSVVGRLIRVSGGTFRVAGVAPPEFRGTALDVRPDLWLAIDNIGLVPAGAGSDAGATARPVSDMLSNRDRRWMGGTIGRLRPGVTIDQAGADMRAISDGLQRTDPGRAGRFTTVEPAWRAALPPAAAADVTRFVVLLMCGVGATLLIAYANVAGLLLARGTARRAELDVRRALGAGRGRLVRQLMSEHLLLAVAGTVLGVGISGAAMPLLASYALPGGVSIASLDLRLDARGLSFAVLLLGGTTLVGLIPALGATRALHSTMARRTTGADAGTARGQSLLLATQVAVTTLLLVGAGLFIRSLQHGLALDVGLSSRSVVMAEVAPALEGYPAHRTQAIVADALARLTSLPGVQAASAARQEPLSSGSGFLAQDIDGYTPSRGEEIRFESNFVAPKYFEALGIDLSAGREFTEIDRAGAPLVGIVSERMARRYWAGRDPIGTRLRSRSFPEPIRIIGVATDVAVGLDRAAEPFVYLALAQHPRFLNAARPLVLLARPRPDSNPSAVAASMRGVLTAVDPALPVTEVTRLDDRIAGLLMPQRLGVALLSVLGVLTVLLVVVGAGGSVAYGVARRRREIGIRLALGARRASVASTMTRSAVVAIAAGVAGGLLAAAALGRLVSAFLYGIEATDPATFATVVAVLVTAAGLASFLPAWRAAGIDPAEILKGDVSG